MGKIKKNSELAQARAQRVRGLRDALRYSREKFSEKYAKHEITASALQSWEAIRWNGLTESGARKLAACFQEEGLNVTVEWLMYGIGANPLEQAIKKGLANIMPENYSNRVEEQVTQYTVSTEPLLITNKSVNSEKENIAEELKLFHQLNPGCIDAIITDDSLSPWLLPGDYVAGPRYFDNDMERGINHPCIIQTLEGNTLIRILKPGDDIGLYNLICTNPATNATETILENIKLFSAAPIIWIRKALLKRMYS